MYTNYTPFFVKPETKTSVISKEITPVIVSVLLLNVKIPTGARQSGIHLTKPL